jgi:hypothetical protein
VAILFKVIRGILCSKVKTDLLRVFPKRKDILCVRNPKYLERQLDTLPQGEKEFDTATPLPNPEIHESVAVEIAITINTQLLEALQASLEKYAYQEDSGSPFSSPGKTK